MVAQEELCLGLQGGRRQETGTPLTGTQGTTYYVLASEQVYGEVEELCVRIRQLEAPQQERGQTRRTVKHALVKSQLSSETSRIGIKQLSRSKPFSHRREGSESFSVKTGRGSGEEEEVIPQPPGASGSDTLNEPTPMEQDQEEVKLRQSERGRIPRRRFEIESHERIPFLPSWLLYA
ncbi:hypothetical protein V6N12_057955 [Hibiscus sabdariffa]|uniref:Uncharacterized protein n=1 Tax=Hibiscus sabdariffa TaxID=183260 RepID=A0ABR2AFN8_9ROSI